MSILLYVEGINSVKSRVVSINHHPKHPVTGVPQEVIDKNILVESAPTSEDVVGKMAIHYINPQTKEQWFEYVDRALTPDEEIKQLKIENSDLQLALVELVAANEQDKMETQLAIAELANIVTGGVE